jgi:hypothetical protein
MRAAVSIGNFDKNRIFESHSDWVQ